MQHRIILNKNSNFQFWTASSPDDYTVTPAGGDVIQLDRHMDRKHPQRQVFPKHLKAHDLVKDGDFAFRFVDTSGGGQIQLQTSIIAVAPGQQLSTSFAYRYTDAPDSFLLRIELFPDITAASKVASVGQPAAGNLVPDPVNTRQTEGQPAGYNLDATGGLGGGRSVRFVINAAAVPIEYWTRYGAQVEIPMGVGAMAATLDFEVDTPGTVVDFDDFRIEALDSRVHAGG